MSRSGVSRGFVDYSDLPEVTVAPDPVLARSAALTVVDQAVRGGWLDDAARVLDVLGLAGPGDQS